MYYYYYYYYVYFSIFRPFFHLILNFCFGNFEFAHPLVNPSSCIAASIAFAASETPLVITLSPLCALVVWFLCEAVVCNRYVE